MDRHLPSTHIQSKLFGYISFIQIFFYCFLSNFGRPLHLLVLLKQLRIPLCTDVLGDLRWIWPNNYKRCWTSFFWISATLILSCISSFLIWSLIVWPHIQRNIHISATLIFCMCCPFVAQHYASYINMCLIVVP
jgi:hypothetical protein